AGAARSGRLGAPGGACSGPGPPPPPTISPTMPPVAPVPPPPIACSRAISMHGCRSRPDIRTRDAPRKMRLTEVGGATEVIHEGHSNPARFGPEPLARQHHAQLIADGRAPPLYRRVLSYRADLESDDLRSRDQEQRR